MFATVRSKIVILSAHSKKLSNLLLLSSANNFHHVSKSSNFFKTVRFKHSTVPGIQYTPPGSRYVPPDPVESAEMSILSALKNKTFMTDEDWEDFKSKLFEQENFISEENFSSIVMNTLLSSNQLNFSHTFLKYAEKCDVKPNFLTYLKYISLCSKNRKAVNQEHILKIIDKVKKEIDASPVLDNKRAEYIVQGLCATDRWRESFQYFDKLLSGKPTRVMCTSVACAALRNNDETLAWEILTKWINKYDIVDDAVIQEFVEFALEIQAKSCYESDKFLEKLFHYMQERDVIVNMDVAKLIEVYFKSHHLKWSVTHTKVRRHGYCEKCNFRLKLLNLRDQDFNDLREAFLQRAVMKSDIYINTTAREFKNYMELIDTFKPFHVVLDGLNAAYSYQGFISKKNLSMHTQEYYSQKVFQIQLLRVVNKLAGKRRKLLVLGRKHMKGWPNIQKICDRAQLFFTDNISQDDPFTVYAALASGPHTLFLSGDLMRDHYSRLDDPRLIHLFKRWQLSHQMFLKISDYNEIEFVEPVRHSITAQGSMEHGWHIPFDNKIILDPYEELNNWLCIKKCI